MAIPTGEYAKDKALLYLPGEVPSTLNTDRGLLLILQQMLMACPSLTLRSVTSITNLTFDFPYFFAVNGIVVPMKDNTLVDLRSQGR